MLGLRTGFVSNDMLGLERRFCQQRYVRVKVGLWIGSKTDS